MSVSGVKDYKYKKKMVQPKIKIKQKFSEKHRKPLKKEEHF